MGGKKKKRQEKAFYYCTITSGRPGDLPEPEAGPEPTGLPSASYHANTTLTSHHADPTLTSHHADLPPRGPHTDPTLIPR
ncbi:hypothetical protein FKM82_022150 [Ascaphus truei]